MLIYFSSQLQLSFTDMNLIVFALCILAKFSSAGANEPRGSRNIACLSNTQVIITCAIPESDSLYIDWYFLSRRSFLPQLLTNNTGGSNIYTNYLMIKISNGESLVINSVQLLDAGVYYCGTVNATGEASTEVGSHLTVFASDPTCDVKNFTVMENDFILLQCLVIYGGLWRPAMKWTQLGFFGQEKINNESISVNVTESQQNASMTVSLQILAKPYHNDVSFVCRTYFDYGDMLEKKKVSKNTPEYKYVWESPRINVLYGTRNVSIYPASDIFYPGDKLSCSAFGNPQPEYQWIESETVYVGWQIEINQSMIRNEPYVLRCKAHNSVSESFADITFTVQTIPICEPDVNSIETTIDFVCNFSFIDNTSQRSQWIGDFCTNSTPTTCSDVNERNIFCEFPNNRKNRTFLPFAINAASHGIEACEIGCKHFNETSTNYSTMSRSISVFLQCRVNSNLTTTKPTTSTIPAKAPQPIGTEFYLYGSIAVSSVGVILTIIIIAIFRNTGPCVRRIRDDPMFTINHPDVGLQMAAAIPHVREEPVYEGISSAVYADIQDINISPIYQQAEESSAHYMELSERNHALTVYETLHAL